MNIYIYTHIILNNLFNWYENRWWQKEWGISCVKLKENPLTTSSSSILIRCSDESQRKVFADFASACPAVRHPMWVETTRITRRSSTYNCGKERALVLNAFTSFDLTHFMHVRMLNPSKRCSTKTPLIHLYILNLID